MCRTCGCTVFQRRHHQVSVHHAVWEEGGDRLHSRWRPGHTLRVLAGGVQDELSLLPNRQTGVRGQSAAADILNQVYSLPEADRLTNIVFMGQGEPMDNLDAVLCATTILTAPYGWAWSPKRITVSSVGVKNKLKRFLDESECHVAISLHSPIPEQRSQLMPAERGMSITDVVNLLHQYDFTRQRRLSFEYIVFGGVNDSMTHAREIIRLLDGLECRVNLIRFHQIPGVPLHGADEKKMETLRDYLTAHGVFTTIRASRGQDIYAACGLLSTARKIEEQRHAGNPEE